MNPRTGFPFCPNAGTLALILAALWVSSCSSDRQLEVEPALAEIDAMVRGGRVEDARAALQGLIRSQPEEAAPHVYLGRLCLAQRDLDCAQAAFQSALRLDPESYWARRGLGGILTATDEGRKDGIALLESCTRDQLGDVGALDLLGRAYLLDGRFEEAADLLRRVVSNTAPEDPTFAGRLAWLQRAQRGAPRRTAQAGAPNLVLIVLDTVRADHLGCYGYARPTSPHLDALAAQSVVFEHASSQAPWTASSLASLFTGLYPSVHGLDGGITWGRSHPTDDLPFAVQRVLGPQQTTLAEVLRERGYATAGFVSNVYANSIFGLAQGFEIYDDRHLDYSSDPLHAKRRSTETNRAVFDWMEEDLREPFFLLVHYNDGHWPYAPPAPFDEFVQGYRGSLTPQTTGEVVETFGAPAPDLSAEDLAYLVGLYDGEIQAVDHAVGALLDRLEEALLARGSLRESMVIVTADHGEEFLDHGSTSHGYTLYEEQLHVPLIVHAPTRYEARRVEAPVRLIDVFPTVVEWTNPESSASGPTPTGGLERGQAPAVQGQTLTPLLTGRSTMGPDLVGAEASYVGHLRALRTRNGKKIIRSDAGDRVEVYDLAADPRESQNRAVRSTEWAAGLADRLDQWIADNRALHTLRSLGDSTQPAVTLNDEMRERLRSLGYIR